MCTQISEPCRMLHGVRLLFAVFVLLSALNGNVFAANEQIMQSTGAEMRNEILVLVEGLPQSQDQVNIDTLVKKYLKLTDATHAKAFLFDNGFYLYEQREKGFTAIFSAVFATSGQLPENKWRDVIIHIEYNSDVITSAGGTILRPLQNKKNPMHDKTREMMADLSSFWHTSGKDRLTVTPIVMKHLTPRMDIVDAKVLLFNNGFHGGGTDTDSFSASFLESDKLFFFPFGHSRILITCKVAENGLKSVDAMAYKTKW